MGKAGSCLEHLKQGLAPRPSCFGVFMQVYLVQCNTGVTPGKGGEGRGGRSFKAAAGAGCFFRLTPTAAQSPFPVSWGQEVMLPGGACSSSLHPALGTEERKIIPASKQRLHLAAKPAADKSD